jgi:GNAT superfamily N-acetyltransferase
VSDYRIRSAALEDIESLVHHRVAMFEDMGLSFDAAEVADAFRPWLVAHMTQGDYRGWVVESASGAIVAGGGITIIAWPPGPGYAGERLAYVYNVYTEPAHRHHGLAGRVMKSIHAWCRAEGVTSLALNASRAGQPLYERLGYAVTASPMMFLSLA